MNRSVRKHQVTSSEKRAPKKAQTRTTLIGVTIYQPGLEPSLLGPELFEALDSTWRQHFRGVETTLCKLSHRAQIDECHRSRMIIGGYRALYAHVRPQKWRHPSRMSGPGQSWHTRCQGQQRASFTSYANQFLESSSFAVLMKPREICAIYR